MIMGVRVLQARLPLRGLSWAMGRVGTQRYFSSALLDRASIVCLPGLESVVSSELAVLGIPHKTPSTSTTSKKDGSISLDPSISVDDLVRCCLYLGSASQVRLECASLQARGLPELKRKVARIPWREILGNNTLVATNPEIKVSSSKSKLYHTGAIRDRILQGIREHYGIENGKNYDHKDIGTDQGDRDTTKTSLDVRVVYDQIQIFVNAFLTPLHQRGYRQQVAKAPLREDIAYAMLWSAGWTPAWTQLPTKSHWEGLLDPFCGSGTIAIEGAGMMLGLPPGRFRDRPPFLGTVLEDSTKWKTAVESSLRAAKTTTTDEPLRSISASDRDAGAVEATKANAARAGVLEAISVAHAPLLGQNWFETPGDAPSSLLVVTNPPYGKRISPKSKQPSNPIVTKSGLLPLYQSLGNCLEHHLAAGDDDETSSGRRRHIRGTILTDDPGLWSRTGSRFQFQTSFKTFHGGLRVSAMTVDPTTIPTATKKLK